MKGASRILFTSYCLTMIDFMGYRLNKKSASFHHLIIPDYLNGPKEEWNGVILNGKTSHRYLHIIEQYEPELFFEITSEMIDEKLKGRISLNNLLAIDEMLNIFESKYDGYQNENGKILILPEYKKRFVKEK